MPSSEPHLSVVATRLRRLKDPAGFTHQLQCHVDALGVPSEVIAGLEATRYILRGELILAFRKPTR